MNKFAIVAFFVLLCVIGIGVFAFTVQRSNHVGSAITPTNTPVSITQTASSVSPSPTVSVSTDMSGCLPSDARLTDIVSAVVISSGPSGYHIKKVTVAQKLTELHASCNTNRKLVDNTGKEIRFYQLTGCWGNAPADYQDILAKQRQELEQLSQHSTVIQMTCNPSGIPPA